MTAAPRSSSTGGGQGEEELREMITEVMRPDGVRGHPDDITITTGSQQALDLISEIFINPGDVVVAEAPSYVGALGTFRAYQASVVHVTMDEHGLVPQELEETSAASSVRAARSSSFTPSPTSTTPAACACR